ncbi:MAG: CoA transferase [Chloroflexi bacterium]|nr:CoA transferase [Chloroflexota bacterium]
MPLPLEGIRILDLSRIWAGPYATKLLADTGAEVIKLESLKGYDPHRGPLDPPPGSGNYPQGEPGSAPWNRAGWFNALHMSKYGITLDLAQPRGRDLFGQLVQVSDALIENFRFGTLERLGLGYAKLRSLRPDIVVVSMPSFGNSGPWRSYIQYGIGQEQLAGMASMTGYLNGEPMRSGVNHGDPITGSHAAGILLAALLYRRRTGRGMFIDLSQQESAVCLIGEHLLGFQMTGRNPASRGNRHPSMAPHGVYPCRGDDSWVTIAVSTDHEWRALCEALGCHDLLDDPRFAGPLARWHNQEALDEVISAWTRERESQQVAEVLQLAGVPAAPVLTAPGLLSDPQYRERGVFVEATHPDAGTHLYPGIAWKMSRTPGQVRWAAPRLGEHNHYILGTLLGLGSDEILELEERQIAGTVPVGAAKGQNNEKEA